MFLAIKEILYTKGRYVLIAGVIFLITYLVFFLAGLAYGLAIANRTSVDSWHADGIVLSSSANKNLMASSLQAGSYSKVEAADKAPLVAMATVVKKVGEPSDKKIDTVFFGINQDSFIAPRVIEGVAASKPNEVVADISVQKVYGLAIGDIIQVISNGEQYKIVGFTSKNQFNTSPVIFTSLKNAEQLKYREINQNVPDILSAIVVRGITNNDQLPSDLQYVTTTDFISNIPGYQPQILTFGLMISMLVLIAAVVICIFMYVLTLQKKQVFGIMKAQGISSKVISRSVLFQTAILALAGVLAGLAFTVLTSLGLPSKVPYVNSLGFFGAIGSLLIVMSLTGALFSVRSVSKIDPLEALK